MAQGFLRPGSKAVLSEMSSCFLDIRVIECPSQPSRQKAKALNLCRRFPDLLRELDRDRTTLGVRSYGLSVTTMEEVFLNVSQAAHAVHAATAASPAATATTANGTSGVDPIKEADVRPLPFLFAPLKEELLSQPVRDIATPR